MVSMLHSLRSSAQCQSLGVIRLPHHSRTGLRHVEQIMSAFTVLTALAFISRAGATIPPVNKTYPYDSETSSCFFMGRASTFRINYNINADICVSFYGRLEMDAKMEESELQEINSIEGCVIISGTKIEHADLRQIQHIRPNPEFCEYTHALLIYNNRDLKSIEFTNQLTLDRPEDVFIGLNPALTPAGVTGASFKFDFTSEKGVAVLFRIRTVSLDVLVICFSHLLLTHSRSVGHTCQQLLTRIVLRIVWLYQGLTKALSAERQAPPAPLLFPDCLITEVTPKSKCTRIVGDVRVEQLSTDLWEQIRVVHGTLRIENSDLPYLNSLSNLKIEAWKLPALVISKNSQLIDISALLTMEIEPKENFFEIRDNPNICHNIVERKMLEKWLASRNVSVQFKTDCLTSCFGGSVSIGYLEGIDKLCNTIKGDLRIEGIKMCQSSIRSDNKRCVSILVGMGCTLSAAYDEQV
ncbi:hypothetical protein Y032_0212g2220 [Ancylostoma ceylanicum]|nr:hypothetical protein Y032_0212g2220 [Ancylostoma ceylanicum]